MTRDEIINNLKLMFEKRKQLRDSEKARRLEEEALAVEYKVSECNQKRSEIIQRYQSPQQALRQEIFDLENLLGE